MQSNTRQIAEFVANLKLSDIPQEVVSRAKSIILDGLGCGLFGANVRWTKLLAKVVKDLEPGGGRVSVWGRGETTSATSAALLNGTMIQGYELDDANPATIHSCAVVLPAAIAAAEHIGSDTVDGARLLTAIIAGFEVGPRVGLCMNGNKMLIEGWHAPSVFGPFPAAVATGNVLGLDADLLYQALGIAGPLAGGLMATQFGSMVKRMLSAKACQSGIYAAMLAANGFTGTNDIFEEKYGGYCTTFTHSAAGFDLAALSDGLGTRWETMRISIKRHACVGTNLAALDAIEALMDEGLRPEQVDRIIVRMTEDAVRHSYWVPYEPAGLTAAQMHLGFCIGMKLIEGEVFVDEMIENNIDRPDIIELCNRVEVLRDEEREKKGRAFARGAEVEVFLRTGGTMKKTVDNFLGSFQRPMSEGQMAAKFRRLAAKALPAKKVDELQSFVGSLELAPSVSRLTEILKG
jgi:aconitate decarboxylase